MDVTTSQLGLVLQEKYWPNDNANGSEHRGFGHPKKFEYQKLEAVTEEDSAVGRKLLNVELANQPSDSFRD